MISAIGRRYAKALVEVITDPRTAGARPDPNQILGQLRAIEGLIKGSTALNVALLSPAVAGSRKRAVMARLLEPLGAATVVRNFVFVVIDHRRVHEFPSIIEAFDRLLDERLGVLRGEVASAFALTVEQRSEVEAQLSRLSGKKAKLEYKLDENLIGGVVARIGARIYDGSVRGQLERLRVKLAAGV